MKSRSKISDLKARISIGKYSNYSPEKLAAEGEVVFIPVTQRISKCQLQNDVNPDHKVNVQYKRHERNALDQRKLSQHSRTMVEVESLKFPKSRKRQLGDQRTHRSKLLSKLQTNRTADKLFKHYI